MSKKQKERRALERQRKKAIEEEYWKKRNEEFEREEAERKRLEGPRIDVDGDTIYTCDECKYCTRVWEDMPFDQAVEAGLVEEYYGMVGGCGCEPEYFWECYHPDNGAELSNWGIEEHIHRDCPLEFAPEEEEDE